MRDFFGNLLSEGDYVVYPRLIGQRMNMSVRFVTRVDLAQKKVWTVSVERGYRNDWSLEFRDGKETAVRRSETMVRVPRESVPDEARALLNHWESI